MIAFCTAIIMFWMTRDFFTSGAWFEVLKGLQPQTVAFSFLIVAVVLYVLKSRDAFVYGLIEVFVALLTLRTVPGGIHQDQSLSAVVSILGGTYILVRGLDNMSKNLPNWIETIWYINAFGPVKGRQELRRLQEERHQLWLDRVRSS